MCVYFGVYLNAPLLKVRSSVVCCWSWWPNKEKNQLETKKNIADNKHNCVLLNRFSARITQNLAARNSTCDFGAHSGQKRTMTENCQFMHMSMPNNGNRYFFYCTLRFSAFLRHLICVSRFVCFVSFFPLQSLLLPLFFDQKSVLIIPFSIHSEWEKTQ